jgi:hypothetical protein
VSRKVFIGVLPYTSAPNGSLFVVRVDLIAPNRWTRERGMALRPHHEITVNCPAEQGHKPRLLPSKAAAHLQIATKTLRLAAEGREPGIKGANATRSASAAALGAARSAQSRFIPLLRANLNKLGTSNRTVRVCNDGNCHFVPTRAKSYRNASDG